MINILSPDQKTIGRNLHSTHNNIIKYYFKNNFGRSINTFDIVNT